MQIWTPRWSIRPPAEAAPATSRIGGLVAGSAVDDWPDCAECGAPMPLLLRLTGGPWLPRIPVDRVLLVFKCEDMCNFWEYDSGANACRIVPAADLVDVDAPAAGSSGTPPILPTIWLTDWVGSDDAITPAQAAAIDDPDRFADLPDEIAFPHGFDSEKNTKAGGAPYWTGNGVQIEPPHPRRLLFQLDQWVTVIESASEVAEFLPPDALERNGMYYSISGASIEFANFMSDGVAYIFDTTPGSPTPTPRMTIVR